MITIGSCDTQWAWGTIEPQLAWSTLTWTWRKEERNKKPHLPISPTLNMNCASIAAIFHTCKSPEWYVNRSQTPLTVFLCRHQWACEVLREILWGSNTETKGYADIVRGKMSLHLSVVSKLPPLTVSVQNLFLFPEPQHRGGGDLLIESQSQLSIVRTNGAFMTIGKIDVTIP